MYLNKTVIILRIFRSLCIKTKRIDRYRCSGLSFYLNYYYLKKLQNKSALLEEKGTTQISRFRVDNQGGLYRRNTNRKDSCADAIAATVFLMPSVVTQFQNYCVDINDDTASPEYGKLILNASTGEHDISFVTQLDAGKYWNFITDLLCQVSETTD